MEAFVLVGIGFICGVWFHKLYVSIRKQIIELRIEKEIDAKVKTLKEKIIPSRIEEANGLLFLYNNETNEFLGQGANADELETSVKARFPGKLFNVPQEQLDKYFKETK
jgi:predicted sulfurtransferase